MMNPLTWAVSKWRNAVWKWQYDRTPVTHLGAMLVKDFRGALYCVGFDNIRLETIALLKSLPKDANYGPVLAFLEKLEACRD